MGQAGDGIYSQVHDRPNGLRHYPKAKRDPVLDSDGEFGGACFLKLFKGMYTKKDRLTFSQW
jgi:hypothetical protein